MKRKEIRIAKTDDLQNGEMKTLNMESGSEILLIKIDNKYYATDPYCPHYGAPLETGIIAHKKIVCPWHHAAFDVQTGKFCDPPALNDLLSYHVEVRGNDVVLFPEETTAPTIPKELKGKKKKSKEQVFIIIGGGAAGHTAALMLRRLGFEGRIQIISGESRKPYDRTVLSKDFLKGDMENDWLPLNQNNDYKKYRIDFILNRRVTKVDSFGKAIELDNHNKINYDKLLVASGGKPKKLVIPGHDLGKIFSLRTVSDAEEILKSAQNTNKIAILGASFIGLEVAENLNHENREIHIIAPESIPFNQLLGENIGMSLKEKMEDKGIKFHLGNTVSEFRGDTKLKELVLDNGATLRAGMAVIGIGVNPVSDFMPPFNKVTDGSLLTDMYLQVENDIFAAGDVATFPYWKSGELIRIEHWRVAEQLGIIAAQNMLGKKKKVEIIPFFWSNIAGMNLRYVGYTRDWDDTIVQGDISKEDFIVYYIKDKVAKAALGVNRDEQMAIIAELFRHDNMPSVGELKKGNWSPSRI